MSNNATRDAIAFIQANPELFSAAVSLDDDGNVSVDVSALENQAVRGDALNVVERKSTFSETARGEFVDTAFSFAADIAAGIKKSGTSGNHRLTLTTPSGSLTIELKPEGE